MIESSGRRLPPLFLSTRQAPALSRHLLGAAFVAMVLAWLIPNHSPPWTSFYNDAAMALGLAALLTAIGSSPWRGTSRVPLSAWVVSVVALVPWLQFATGTLVYSGDAFVASAYVGALAVSIHAGHAWMSSGDRRLPLLLSWAALVAAGVSTVIAIAQVLDVSSWAVWAESTVRGMRAAGNLAQPNNLATLFGLGAAAAFYLFERERLSSFLVLFAVGFLEIGAALTQSRMSLAFGPLAIAIVWILQRRTLAIKTPVRAVVALTLAHWLVMAAMPGLLDFLLGDAPADLATRGVGSPRYQMWAMLLDAVRAVPWQGYGWLQVGAAELAVADRYPPINELWLQGHNVFVELIVWCGWPLGLSLAAALVFWFASRIRRLRSVEAAAGMLVIGFVSLHALVELPHHYLYFLVPVGLWAGIVESEERARSTRGGVLMLVPALAVLLTLGGIAIEYPKIEEDVRLVRLESARIVGARALEKSPDAPLLSSLTAFLEFARTEPAAGLSAAQLHAMSAATKRYPYAASLVRYASALSLNGQRDEARRTFVKIRYIYGDKMYVRLKNDLHDRVHDGESGLAQLDADLPDVARLSP